MEKVKIIRGIFCTLMILTCIIIFYFSSQDGEKSSSLSNGFINKIIDIWPTTRNETEEKKKEIIENVQFAVRKLAHFSIYTILGINTIGFINTYNITFKKKIFLSMLIGVLYAISDEIHQLFSFGRTAKIMDVCIDSVGVMFGIMIFLIVIKMFKKDVTKK